jgi:hypothetical protein
MTAIEASRLSKIAHIEIKPVEVTRQPFRAATFGQAGAQVNANRRPPARVFRGFAGVP